MERVATELMRIFAVGLGMDKHFFDDKVDRHITNFSVLHYPEQPKEPLPGQLRAGAHTDYGSLTILKPDNAPGGLQVLGKEGAWIDVPTLPGTFVVNLGDLMAEWTNDRWVSTLHRVINPPRDKALGSRRISMAFFHQPNYDAIIECLPTCSSADRPARYGRPTSGEHVWMKITKHRTPELAQAKA
jgi:isopenicillin N synthase-like dioxygenase